MHVIVPESYVHNVCDEEGLEVTEEVTDRVCEDTTNEVHELIKTAEVLAQQERCDTLTDRHLQLAAKLLDIHYPISTATQLLSKVEISSEERIYVDSTPLIDLYDMTLEATSEVTLPPLSLDVRWLSNGRDIKTTASLSPSIFKYFTLLCQHCISKDMEEMCQALEELNKSPKISLIIPYFVQFIDQKLKDNSLISENTVILLASYKHLLKNKTIYLEPYIPNLLDISYSLCCDWTSSREAADNPISIIEHSADIAAFIVLNHSTPRYCYYDKYTKFCRETIDSDEISLSALGSVTLLSKLGPLCVEENIMPLTVGTYRALFEKPSELCSQVNILNIWRVIRVTLCSHFQMLQNMLNYHIIMDLFIKYRGGVPRPIQSHNGETPILAYNQMSELIGDNVHTVRYLSPPCQPWANWSRSRNIVQTKTSGVAKHFPFKTKGVCQALVKDRKNFLVWKKVKEITESIRANKGKINYQHELIIKKRIRGFKTTQLGSLINSTSHMEYFL